MTRFFIFLLTLFVGCSADTTQDDDNQTDTINGRGRERVAVYQIRVPQTWVRRDPLPQDPIEDTTQALCEFLINDPDGIIRIAVHNFPSDEAETRIPPAAQVARWKQQLGNEKSDEWVETPVAFAGYSGVEFLGTGKKEEQEIRVFALALQLGHEHFKNLSVPETSSQALRYRQMRGDVTLKALGPAAAMEKQREAILKAFRSFELIDEIPTRR